MDDLMTVRSDADHEAIPPAPAGSFTAVCVDAIYLGKRVESYQGQPEKLSEKGVLVFQIDEPDDNGKRYEVSKEFTLSFGEKANLRKFLGTWRGKAYSNEEARNGVPLKKCIGVNGILGLEHKESKKGNTYANIISVTPLLKNMAKIAPENYVRAEWWETRIKEYAEGATAWYAKNGNGNGNVHRAAAPTSNGDDDDLPF